MPAWFLLIPKSTQILHVSHKGRPRLERVQEGGGGGKQPPAHVECCGGGRWDAMRGDPPAAAATATGVTRRSPAPATCPSLPQVTFWTAEDVDLSKDAPDWQVGRACGAQRGRPAAPVRRRGIDGDAARAGLMQSADTGWHAWPTLHPCLSCAGQARGGGALPPVLCAGIPCGLW